MVGMFWAYRTRRAFHVAEVAGLTQPLSVEQPSQAVVSIEYQGEQ